MGEHGLLNPQQDISTDLKSRKLSLSGINIHVSSQNLFSKSIESRHWALRSKSSCTNQGARFSHLSITNQSIMYYDSRAVLVQRSRTILYISFFFCLDSFPNHPLQIACLDVFLLSQRKISPGILKD